MADDNVESLQQLIMHGGTQAFSLIPAGLKKVIIEKQWCRRVDKDGKPFATFEAFATHRLWHGLETTIDELQVYCRKEPEIWKIILTELEPGREHRGATKEERVSRDSNTTSTDRGSTYTLKRLKRDRADLFQRVVDGELSANAAAIEAGFRKKTTPFEQVVKLLAKLTTEERRQVHEMTL